MTSIVESVKLGSEALRFSSELYEADLEAAEREAEAAKPPKPPAPLVTFSLWVASLALGSDGSDGPEGAGAARGSTPAPGGGPARAEKGRGLMSALMIGFALLLFVALPQAAAGLTNRWAGLQLDLRSTGFQAMTGAFKLAVVIGYLLLIRSIPEICRVFQYHGAEHKTISTYEAGEPLVVSSARSKSTLHPRCGTTFLVMVALVSIFIFSIAAPLLPRLAVGGIAEHVLLFAIKLPFLPVIAGITFELQRLSARYCTKGALRALLWPGFLVQKITTIEPDDPQLEVALASLRATLWRERAQGSAPNSPLERTFPSYEALMAHSGYGEAA